LILKYVERYINNEKKRVRNKIDSSNPNAKVDSVDTKILELMVEGKVNKEISTLCKIPISTVQRRARNLISSDLVQNDYRLNYEKLGFKTGLLYIYI
jgi:DNA-binding NarL/FixJ family response regulator